jgi:hypothetical protein
MAGCVRCMGLEKPTSEESVFGETYKQDMVIEYLPRWNSTPHGLGSGCTSVHRLYHKDSPQMGLALLHCDVED